MEFCTTLCPLFLTTLNGNECHGIDTSDVNNGGIHIRVQNINYDEPNKFNIQNALHFVPANHAIQIDSIWVRHGHGDNDTNWYRIPRTWQNEYVFAGYQNAYHEDAGDIRGQSINGTFDLKLVSVFGEEITCTSLKLIPFTQYQILECKDELEQPNQFTDIGDHTRRNMTYHVEIHSIQQLIQQLTR